MIIIYRFSGFIASIGVVAYTALVFLIFNLIGGRLTLPGIAAMLLGIGMAVDANVICFERIKENLLIGKNLKDSFEIGVEFERTGYFAKDPDSTPEKLVVNKTTGLKDSFKL